MKKTLKDELDSKIYYTQKTYDIYYKDKLIKSFTKQCEAEKWIDENYIDGKLKEENNNE